MEQHVLEIRKLTSDGEVSKTVRCRSGRITVFRSNSDELLNAYVNVLAGRPSAERFSILLDNVTFNPFDHLILGYESVRFPTGGSVGEVLSSVIDDRSALEPLLLEHGLGGLAEAPVQELSETQKYCVAFLRATAQRHKVMILKDPLDPIPERWKEVYAERLMKYAWELQGIVVVTRLNWRPEKWIDNDLISRVQLDQTVRKATIGAGAVSALTEMAQKIRGEFAADRPTEVQQRPSTPQPAAAAAAAAAVTAASRSGSSPAHAATTTSPTASPEVFTPVSGQRPKVVVPPSPAKSSLIPMAFAFVGAVVITAGAYSFIRTEQRQGNPQGVQQSSLRSSALEPQKDGVIDSEVPVLDSESTNSPNRFTNTSVLSNRIQDSDFVPILAPYHPEIKAGVMRAFSGKIGLSNVEVPLPKNTDLKQGEDIGLKPAPNMRRVPPVIPPPRNLRRPGGSSLRKPPPPPPDLIPEELEELEDLLTSGDSPEEIMERFNEMFGDGSDLGF